MIHKKKKIIMVNSINFEVHYIWYQSKGYNTWTLNRATFLLSIYFCLCKTNKPLLLQEKKPFMFCVNHGSLG
jgi:hypothetical protein